MTALATNEDVEARLGRDLTEAETDQVEALLDDASAVVIGYCRTDFAGDDVPTPVVGVVAKMAARSLARGSTANVIQSETAGPFARTFSAAASSGDVWLTAADKLALRPYRVGGGLVSVGLVSERYDETCSDDETGS